MDFRRCSLDRTQRMMLLLLLGVVTILIQTYLATVRSDMEPQDNLQSDIHLRVGNYTQKTSLPSNISLKDNTVNNTKNEIIRIQNGTSNLKYIKKKHMELDRGQGENSSNIIALYDFDSSVLGNDLDLSRCKERNCELISNYIANNASHIVPKVILFHFDKLPSFPLRNNDQIFILFASEPTIPSSNMSQMSKQWRNQFNWSMTYKQTADISLPTHVIQHIKTGIVRNPNVKYMDTAASTYRKSRNRKSIQRNYYQIVKTKHSLVAWVQQNCCRVCKHDKFVNELKKHVQLDKYDLCNFTESRTNFVKKCIQHYKFVLILEDKLCGDYIPGVVFSLYRENTILILNGDTKYKTQLPYGTYIDINKYKSPQLLANQLNRLNTDDRTYSHILKLKDTYEVLSSPIINQMAMCEVCRRINNMEKFRKTINNLDNLVTEMKRCIQQS